MGTHSTLQAHWHRFRGNLAAVRDHLLTPALRAMHYKGEGLIPQSLLDHLRQGISIRDVELLWHRRSGFMHYPVGISVAPPCSVLPIPANARSRRAAERVVESWHRTKADRHKAAPSLWNEAMYRYYAELLLALDYRDVAKVEIMLNNMFRSSVTWGTARMHWTWPAEMEQNPHMHFCVVRCSDVLFSLGEAIGVKVVPSIEQYGGFNGFRNSLQVELSALVAAIEQTAGLDLSCPDFGGPMGVKINDKLLTIDSILHSYTVYRIQELGAQAQDRLIEIGGGYGCLAYLMHRAGFRDLEIIDLPWQNAVQGFFLLNTLPEDAVCLYGETHAGAVKVMPPWAFGRHADRSVDYVINVNSMTEIGLDDAQDYTRTIGRIVKKFFVSMNHESGQANLGVGPQGPVHKLAEHGRLQRVSRALWWMEQGYVEELYQPEEVAQQTGSPPRAAGALKAA